MINYLWGFMIITGILYGVFTGNTEALSTAAIDSAKDAITLCIAMLGVMLMWTGLINIAKKAGLTDRLTHLLYPVLHLLFPEIPAGHTAFEHISANIAANMLGLGWAATPVGLKAMKELSKLNSDRKSASVSMCTFLIINISSLQLIPVNVIAYRSQYGAANPASIIGAGLISTVVSVAVGVCFSLIAGKLTRPDKKE